MSVWYFFQTFHLLKFQLTQKYISDLNQTSGLIFHQLHDQIKLNGRRVLMVMYFIASTSINKNIMGVPRIHVIRHLLYKTQLSKTCFIIVFGCGMVLESVSVTRSSLTSMEVCLYVYSWLFDLDCIYLYESDICFPDTSLCSNL